MRDALDRHDFGSVFAAIRHHTGMSQTQLAALVGLSQARVSEVEAGTRRLTGAKLVARISTVFSVPAHLLGFHVDSADAEIGGNLACEEVDWVHRRDFVTLATAAALGSRLHPELERLAHMLPGRREPVTRPRIGNADIDAIEAIIDGFRRWDLAHGGGLCRSAALGQLHQVVALGDSVCTPYVRTRLQLATAELASMAGWLAYDIEDHNAARRLWTYALHTAQRCDHSSRATDLMVVILLDMAHQALHLRRPNDALAFCRLAGATSSSRRNPVSDVTAGYIHTVTAWCWAMLGEREPVRRALADARSGYAVGADTTPPWAWVVTPAELAAQQGHALYLLSITHPEFAETAATRLTVAAEGHPAEHERSRAVLLPTLSVAHFRAGNIDAAVKTGRDAATAVSVLASQRCLARLRDLDTVAVEYSSEPGVPDMRADIAAALTV